MQIIIPVTLDDGICQYLGSRLTIRHQHGVQTVIGTKRIYGSYKNLLYKNDERFAERLPTLLNLIQGHAAGTSETLRWVGGGDDLSLTTAKHNSILKVRQ